MRFVLPTLVCLAVLVGCSVGSVVSGGGGSKSTPSVSAGGPYTGKVGTAVTFLGAAADAQGDSFTYSWSFGDGSSGSGAIASHTYTTAGAFTVSLTAASSANTSASATATAAIAALSPVASVGGPYTVTLGSVLTLNGAGSADPQGEPLTYAWNFGDGGTASGVSPTHTYSVLGTYTVSLTVTNTSNLSATAVTTAMVQKQPPAANAGGPYTGATSVAITFNGAGSTAPNNQPLTYAWAFGDGGTGTGVSPTHTYTTPGTFTVSLTVTDTDNLSNTATTTATLPAEAPSAKTGGPYLGLVGATITFNGSQSTDPYAGGLYYSWNFGDGVQTVCCTRTATATHVYTTPGTYTVSLTVTDVLYNVPNTATTTATITGSGPSFTGTVMSGTMPMANAHVHLFAANTTGYGNASVPELSGTGYSDSAGPYVPANSSGAFTIPAGYPCTTTTQLYVYADGGTIGTSTNTAAGLMAAVGTCGVSTAPVAVNEVTTVAVAYAIAGYATDSLHVSSSGSANAIVGITNAFNNVTNLVATQTGVALARTPAGNGTVPQALLNTLADLLNACATSGSASSTACINLLSNAKSSGSSGATPTDVASAAINMAHNPASNVSTLFGATALAAPFAPTLKSAPNDFTVALLFTEPLYYSPRGIAIDANGNVWAANPSGSYTPEISPLGVDALGEFDQANYHFPGCVAFDQSNNMWVANLGPLTPTALKISLSASVAVESVPDVEIYDPTGCAVDGSGNAWFSNAAAYTSEVYSKTPTYAYYFSTVGTLTGSQGGIAIDGSGNAWITNSPGNTGGGTSLAKLNPSGQMVGGAPFTASTLVSPNGVAVDANGNVWVASSEGNAITEFSNNGTLLSGTKGFTGGGIYDPISIAVDGGGNIWVSNSGNDTISEITSAGVPVSNSNGFTGGLYNAGNYVYLGLNFVMAIDNSGDVWVEGNNNDLLEFIGVAVPVITPISAGLPATPTANGISNLGTRP
jgi:PKD repeat protein